MKTPSSRLLPCCTPFPSSPPLLSFVLLSLSSLFSFSCVFLRSNLRPAQYCFWRPEPSKALAPPHHPLLGSSWQHRYGITIANQHARRPQQKHHQPANHPSPPATTAARHALGSNPVRFAREATSFLSASSLCASHYRSSLASSSSLRLLRARHARLLGPFVHRLAFSPTKACISRQSAPSERPSGPATTANSTARDLLPRARTSPSPRRF